MTKRILIAYATGAGSTAEVAATIGDVLLSDNVDVDVLHVANVDDMARYSAVVLGSSIRAGRWLPGAIDFLQTQQEKMAKIPVAYFTTCLTMVKNTPESRRIVLDYLEPVHQLAPKIAPVGLGLFAGSLNPDLQQILPGTSGPYGDFRDWDAIRAWAGEIRPFLLTSDIRQAAKIVLSESILSYTDLSGLDLRHVNLTRAELHETNLQRAKLHRANMRESELIKADLRNSDLREAGLSWADLSHSDLREANLSQANLMGAILQESNLSKANLTQAVLNGATLTGCKLVETNLTGADLNWANLSHSDLTKADLRHANLSWADLSHTTLANTNLNEATYNGQTKWPNGFSAAEAGCILLDQSQ